MKKWWEETVFYQIYMPSFCDGNGDGIGDFIGITNQLTYLKELGVGCIWLTPFYPSPKIDNGYDISDYYSIAPEYGAMKDFEHFMERAKQLNIKVISDIVINHTSAYHPWFLESRQNKTNKKRDWYIWKPKIDGKKPNNWESFFGEEAWEWDAVTQEYYYHSFAKEQVDLNWSNQEVKEEIFKMLSFWLDKGLSGFRFDVINNLTTQKELKDNPTDKNGNQIHQYDVNQEGIQDILEEIRTFIKKKGDYFLVGEISSDQLEVIHSYVGRKGMDTTFNFNLGSRENFEFASFYREILTMNQMYQKEELPTIFFGSHDMGRFASRFSFQADQIKCLFTFMLVMRGIPFLYFGDEIGMRDYICNSLEDARDIQGIIAYQKAKKEGKKESEAIEQLNKVGRDKSRNTMQWNTSKNGGFTLGTPWIPYQSIDSDCNVETQKREPDSILSFVKQLIHLKNNRLELSYGNVIIENPQEQILQLKREYHKNRLEAIINFSANPKEILVSLDFSYNILLASKSNVTLFNHILYVPPQSSVILEKIDSNRKEDFL